MHGFFASLRMTTLCDDRICRPALETYFGDFASRELRNC